VAVLLDVNVLVALAWPNHIHHGMAVQWFLGARGDGWATSPASQSGFVRVSSNRAIIPEAKPPGAAVALLRRLTDADDHVFWPDDISLCRSPHVSVERIVGHRQVTDAHFVALALRHHGRLATFDRGLEDVIPPGVTPDHVLVILR